MIAFVGSAITIVSIGAALACLFVFRLIFPRHVLKVKEWQILPLAVPIIFAIGLPILIFAIRHITFPTCDSIEGSFATLAVELSQAPKFLWCVLGSIALLYIIPMALTFGLAKAMKFCWQKESVIKDLERVKGRKRKGKLGFLDKISIWISDFVTGHILNEFSKTTAYSSSLEELMVDVRTTDGYLFSGKFSDYHWDGESYTGISMTNIMRFNDCSGASQNKDHEENGKRIYLFPNNGRMVFTSDKIQDIHFWRIHHRQNVSRKLDTAKDAKILAWWLSLQWAMPALKIKVTAITDENINQAAGDELMEQLGRFKLTTKQVKLTVDIRSAAPAISS